jgi:hypothetical protein
MAAAGMGTINLKVPHIGDSTRVWFNPDLTSRNYFVPGVVCNLILVVTVMLTAMAIVRDKEIGTMEQLMVTPIRPIELMIGKMIPAAMLGMLDLVMITSAALLIFDIPFRGSVAAGSQRGFIPVNQPGHRLVHLHCFANPATGHHVVVADRHTDFYAERLRVLHPQHAGGGAVLHVFESPPVSDRDRARDLSQGYGHLCPLAAVTDAADLRHGHYGAQREQFPQETGLVRKS